MRPARAAKPPRAAPPRLAAPLAVLLAGCAAVPVGPPAASPEAALKGVRTLALVHRLDGAEPPDRRRRDPLDALQEAVEGRGLATVSVDLPERPAPEQGAIADAVRGAEYLALGAQPDAGVAAVGSIGGGAAPALAAMGADAFAVFVRGTAYAARTEPLPLLGQPRAMAPASAPTSAIAIVARDGTVVAVAWGGAGQPWGAAPANAAEAVEALLPALLGVAPE